MADLIEEIFDEKEGPAIVAYRRRVTKTEKMLLVTEDDEYPYHIQIVEQYTVECATDHPETTSKGVKVKLTNLLCPLGSDIDQLTDRRLSSQPDTDYWEGRLPRSIAQVLNTLRLPADQDSGNQESPRHGTRLRSLARSK